MAGKADPSLTLPARAGRDAQLGRSRLSSSQPAAAVRLVAAAPARLEGTPATLGTG